MAITQAKRHEKEQRQGRERESEEREREAYNKTKFRRRGIDGSSGREKQRQSERCEAID